jgi:hypothetical protein
LGHWLKKEEDYYENLKTPEKKGDEKVK